MSIATVSTNYTNRLVDINIAGGKDPNKAGLSTVTCTFGTTSSYVTGIQKLVQRYAICLMTTLGSQVDTPSFGTSFPNMLGGNYAQYDIQHKLVFANAKIITEFREYQQARTLPLDEQVATIIINSVTYDAGVLNVQLTLSTLAGDSVEYILPLPMT